MPRKKVDVEEACVFNSYVQPHVSFSRVDAVLKEAWTIAIETLSWMDMRKLSEPLALSKTVKQLGIADRDAVRLVRVLVSETVRRQNFIEAFVNNIMKPLRLDQLSLGVQAFLRLYVYQTRMARHWSGVNLREAEDIVKLGRSILGWKTLRPIELFLGTLLTQRPEVVYEQKSDAARVAINTFHPAWFVEYCFKLLGRREAIALLESEILPLPTYVRFNTFKAGQKEIAQRLDEDGVELEKADNLAFTYEIKSARQPITKTACFKEGLVCLQDKASSFVAEAANPSDGASIFDVCCAPGVLTASLAQLMENDGRILSLDYSSRRMVSWKSAVTRFGVKIAEPVIADACSSLPFTEEADLIVLDPPCTGTGMFGKLPSSKWRLTQRSVDRMADIQWTMLNKCSEYVKSGGNLVYTTLSITVEENEMLIERFLRWHPDFALTGISPKMGLSGLRGLDKCQRLYPHVHRCNGLFIAKLVKNG